MQYYWLQSLLYIVSPELIHLITENLYLLNCISPSFPPLYPSSCKPPFDSVFLSSVFWDSMYQWDHTVFVFAWLISLKIMSSILFLFLQMVRFPSFSWLNDIPVCVCVCVCMYHIFFIHLSMDRGCFCTLAVVNNTAMNTEMKMYMRHRFQLF